MITKLTEEQRQALHAANDTGPVSLVDPETNRSTPMEVSICEEEGRTNEASGPTSVRPMTAIERQQHEDARWAAMAPEVQQHVGKFVAVHRKRVVAVGTDPRAVVEQAAAQAQCPWWEPFVALVPRPDFWETPK